MKHVAYDSLYEFVTTVLTTQQVPREDAETVADCLLWANLSGVDSHGIIRLPHYVRRLQNRSIAAVANVRYDRPRPGLLRVSGGDGLGHVVTSRAVARGLELVRETGSVGISIGDSSHNGMAGYYLRDITNAGCVGMVTTHTDVRIVPHGARSPFAGTNPIAFGFPTRGEPFVIDFATTSVSFGKIALAKTEGRSIPLDWAMDENGEPTTDPNAAVGMHAIAGYKGAGLAMAIDLFCSMFSGMPYGPQINRMYDEMNGKRKLGHFVTIWDISALVPEDAVRDRMEAYIKALHALPRQDPDTPIRYPGEPEAINRARRRSDGIPLEDGLVSELTVLGDDLGVATGLFVS